MKQIFGWKKILIFLAVILIFFGCHNHDNPPPTTDNPPPIDDPLPPVDDPPPVVNTAPVIDDIRDQFIKLGEKIEDIDLFYYVTDTENSFSTLDIEIEQTNSEAVDCTLNEGIISSGKGLSAGENDVTIIVIDPDGLEAEKTFRVTVEEPNVVYKISVNFSPYMDGQNPNLGSVISVDQLLSRMKIIKPYVEWVRTFGTDSGLENAGSVAHELGLKIAVGAWLSKDKSTNSKQMTSLINMALRGEVDCAIIGSETLLRGDLSESELLSYIN